MKNSQDKNRPGKMMQFLGGLDVVTQQIEKNKHGLLLDFTGTILKQQIRNKETEANQLNKIVNQ